MAGRTKIHSVDEVRRWYEQGLTYQEMSDLHMEKYGEFVAASSFAAVRSRMGWPPRRAGQSPLMPWEVERRHRSSYIYRQLRREIRRRAGLPWLSGGQDESTLDAWIEGLREAGAVVDYRPNTKEGFFLTYRREGVDHDLIREPDTPS